MFDFSFAEILFTVVVAVVFIGPKELPVVLKTLSKAMRSVRSLAGEIRQAFDDLSQESGLKDVTDEVRQEMRMIKGDDGNMYESFDVSKVLPHKNNEA